MFADSDRYSGICNDLKNSTLLDTYIYPKTTTSAYDSLCYYNKPVPPLQVHTQPTSVTFIQIGDTKKNKKIPGNDVYFEFVCLSFLVLFLLLSIFIIFFFNSISESITGSFHHRKFHCLIFEICLQLFVSGIKFTKLTRVHVFCFVLVRDSFHINLSTNSTQNHI